MQAKNLKHKKVKLGPLPLIDQVLGRLGFSELLLGFVKNKRYAGALEILVKNIMVEPSALYRIPKWAQQFELQGICGGKLGDDLLGRALDKLFVADRASLQTGLTLKTIEAYEVDTSTIHNDSTSVKFYGAYKDQLPRAVKLKKGHSKDHRPDLKQLVYNLSVTEDGAVPIHFKCFDGNRTDDTIHIETWLTLRGILGRSDFLYVADSKLCTTANMRKIDHEGGKFITIVPQTRSETKDFAKQCYESQVRWLPLTRRPSTRLKGHYDVFQVTEEYYRLEEGFRVYWYISSEKKKRDEQSRKERIELAFEKLSELQNKKGVGRRTEKSLLKAARRVLDRYNVGPWVNIEVRSRQVEKFKKTSSGKPGPMATYKRLLKKFPYLIITKNHEGIARAKACDGIFPLTTNTEFDAKKTLLAYKYQPYIEKRFSRIKSDYEVAPVFLKNTGRIEALMFAYYIADLIAAIIQRQIRQAMEKNKIELLRTLPENRPTKTPTWEQMQRLFANHSIYELKQGKRHLKTFCDDLNDSQIQVLSLLKIPQTAFTQ